MAKKVTKKEPIKKKRRAITNVVGLKKSVLNQDITDTLELNFMPYAMSVILSRAIPEIDGFKPSHRKLLYTMYKMGLLTGGRTKSANIVGQTMKLNPHGESAIYDTMVRLSKGYEALLSPLVDSKGNFGKVYSRDMAYAASRYTEAKLSAICAEIFKDIDRDTVTFVDNYDSTTTEPLLLPTSFPNILVSANTGIAVGMTSNFCGFNLGEVCQTTIAYLNNPKCDISKTLIAPDFSTGGELLYNKAELAHIYSTGRGSVRLRACWKYDKSSNLIEVTEIPYTTTAEAIIDKVIDLMKAGKLRELNDIRDETGLDGLKLAIEIKRGTDPDKVMAKLFRFTPLMDTFSCNFNVLIGGSPKVLGVREILEAWVNWRVGCIKRRVGCELQKKQTKLHLLEGLSVVLLDIDKAFNIIRKTENEDDVVPNLSEGFDIDIAQAEYVSEIKLRNMNREYILKRTAEIGSITDEINEAEEIFGSEKLIKNIIIAELKAVAKKYGTERNTKIIDGDTVTAYEPEENIESYPVHIFMSQEGYFKKITPMSLKMYDVQTYKDGDGAFLSFESQNTHELLVFTDKQQVYKAKIHDFEDTKASALGTYLPSALGMEAGENVIYLLDPGKYKGDLLFVFENGKVARVAMSVYATKLNRKKLANAYSGLSPVKKVIPLPKNTDIVLYSNDGRVLVFNTELLMQKTTRNTQGVQVFRMNKSRTLDRAECLADVVLGGVERYRTDTIPMAGVAFIEEVETGEELVADEVMEQNAEEVSNDG